MSLTFEPLGYWTPYTPNPIPDGFPPAAIFLRDQFNTDWYAERRRLAESSPQGAVYMTAILYAGGPTYLTQAVQRDLSMVFPVNSLLVRVLGIDPADPKPWKLLEQQIFDPKTLALSAVPPIVPTTCTRLGLKRALEERGLWPTVRAMIASDPNMQEEWDLATVLQTSDPIVQKAIAGLGQLGVALTPADLAALMIRANELVA
jgi:hypothetical protein